MSTTLFFYGSLCHIPLLEVVLGREQLALIFVQRICQIIW